MARIVIAIRPLHRDGTACTHEVKPSGKPADPASGCPGRQAYDIHCSAHGRVGLPHGIRAIAEEHQRTHRSEHLTVGAHKRT